MDSLPGLEDTVRARIVDHQWGAPVDYLSGTDEDSDQDDPLQMVARRPKHGVSGKLRTTDNVVVKTLTWPHEVLYMPSAQPIVYESISTMAFVDGYITVMAKELPRISAIMLMHLQELIEDGGRYGWPAVRVYHTT